MTGRILPLRVSHRDREGTIHVTGDRVEGFTVSHESSSGSSWGEIHGPYQTGQEAIAAAYALNRDQYGGNSNVFVCDAAVEDGCPGVGLASLPGDF